MLLHVRSSGRVHHLGGMSRINGGNREGVEVDSVWKEVRKSSRSASKGSWWRGGDSFCLPNSSSESQAELNPSGRSDKQGCARVDAPTCRQGRLIRSRYGVLRTCKGSVPWGLLTQGHSSRCSPVVPGPPRPIDSSPLQLPLRASASFHHLVKNLLQFFSLDDNNNNTAASTRTKYRMLLHHSSRPHPPERAEYPTLVSWDELLLRNGGR